MLSKHLKSVYQSWKADKADKTDKAAVANTSEEYEFQPGYLEIVERPPSPWARRIALLLTASLVLVLAWSVVGKLDIHASATGRLIVSSYSKEIQSLEGGEITAIHVKDGQRVKMGDKLISLNPIGVAADVKELEQRLYFQLLQVARLRALLSDDPVANFQPVEGVSAQQLTSARRHLSIEWQEILSNINRLTIEIQINQASDKAASEDIAALERLATNIEERLVAWRELAKAQLHSKMQLLEQQKEQLEVNRELIKKHAELVVLREQRKKLEEQQKSYLVQTQREQLDELNSIQIEVTVLEQKLIKAMEKQRLMTLRAPVDGVVQQLAVHTLGGVVQSAQKLMVIVPENSPLEAEVMVLNKDVGFVRANQFVEVKVDAFPYTRYGTIPSQVLHIARDAVEDERLGFVFPARIILSHSAMSIEDEKVPLQAGMSLVAEIHTGERRVIDYLLSPLMQYRSEAMGER